MRPAPIVVPFVTTRLLGYGTCRGETLFEPFSQFRNGQRPRFVQISVVLFVRHGHAGEIKIGTDRVGSSETSRLLVDLDVLFYTRDFAFRREGEPLSRVLFAGILFQDRFHFAFGTGIVRVLVAAEGVEGTRIRIVGFSAVLAFGLFQDWFRPLFGVVGVRARFLFQDRFQRFVAMILGQFFLFGSFLFQNWFCGDGFGFEDHLGASGCRQDYGGCYGNVGGSYG